jgi:hypothetical protein
VKTALLLCHLVRIRQRDLAKTGADTHELRAQMRHHALAKKTRQNALVQGGVVHGGASAWSCHGGVTQ